MTNLEETRYTYIIYYTKKHTNQFKDECIITLFKIEDISNRVIFEDQSIDDTQFCRFWEGTVDTYNNFTPTSDKYKKYN